MSGGKIVLTSHLPDPSHRPLRLEIGRCEFSAQLFFVSAGNLSVLISELAHRCAVELQTFGDDFFCVTVALHRFLKKLQRRNLVPSHGNIVFQQLTFVVDGPP